MGQRIDYATVNPAAINAMFAAKKFMDSIEKPLRALVELRVSQMNGCAYCVDLHATEARALGETQQRLDCLTVLHETAFFSQRERAALRWAETLTKVRSNGAADAAYDKVRPHFNDQELVDLTIIIAQMNAWNRIAIGFAHGPETRSS